jgi:starvation-inducible DNA-binding protein
MQPPPKPPLTLSEKTRQTFARIMDHVLAEECSLLATTREYRGKVTGPNFHSLNKLFEEQRRQLDGWVTRLVERTRAVGFSPAVDSGKSSAAAGMDPAERGGTRDLIDDLLARHEEMSRKLRDEVERLGDPATAELLQRVADFHDTTAWMLRMLLEGPDSGRRAE